MSNSSTEPRCVVVEREMPYPPEKLWRALTQPHLIEEWLMKSDFKSVVGHRFNLRGDVAYAATIDRLVVTWRFPVLVLPARPGSYEERREAIMQWLDRRGSTRAGANGEG